MPDDVRTVSYCYLLLPDRPGEAAKVLRALREAGVNLLGYAGFPAGRGKSQLVFMADDLTTIRDVAKC